MDILHIDNWRFFTPKKSDSDDTPQRQKQYHTYYAPMNIERWALPLFKSVGLVPKSTLSKRLLNFRNAFLNSRALHANNG